MTRHYDGSKPVCVLWKRADGSWSKIHDGLDKDPALPPRPGLRTTTGLFLGSDQGPPWFFPAAPEDKPRRLALPRVFPLQSVGQMTEVDGDRMLLLGRYEGSSCLWPAEAPAVPELDRWETIATLGQALQDARGRIWCNRLDGTFGRWEGAKWIDSPTPPGLEMGHAGFSADDRDRGWLLPVEEGQTAICDFATGDWRVFPSFQEALHSQLPRGVKLTVPQYPFYEPAFSGDGRIGAFVGTDTLLLYEADGWRKWQLTEIVGADGRLAGTPFFAPDGCFSLPIGETTAWQWHGIAGWKRLDGISAPHLGTLRRREEMDAGDVRIASGGTDRFGVIWWLRDRVELCKTA